MCGITAVWGQKNPKLAQAIMNDMIHRGPDASGIATMGKTTLGHTRLSIMDPNGGCQPIYNENDDLVIVANGEIYNHMHLKKKYGKGHEFRTTSDSEVPVHLYEELGTGTAKKLDGMFAFALSDGKEFYAARDAVGIKPLYYGKQGSNILFASELKALAGHAEDVREFPPGYFYHSKTGMTKFKEIPRAEPEERDVEHWIRALRSTMEESVTKRLMSDVPVGAFLSGGLDSSIIAAIARQHVDELHTFAVGIEGSRDLAAARKVAKHIDSIHHEYVFTKEEIINALPEVIYYLESFDQDLVQSAVPTYFVSRLAAEHVKVILTGEGADELFAGYAYYKDMDADAPLHDELYRSVSTLHNLNLQRVDRLTMAHSIEGRVPFLDLNMIELAQRVPHALKLRRESNGSMTEKWILRKAVEDLLPPDIVWRVKEQFDEGSGTVDILGKMGDLYMSDFDSDSYIKRFPEDRIRSHEEAIYHKLLCDSYDDPTAILANVGRWVEGRIE